jgi:TRAP-type mannitol/chloroaromatic compound transport system substrate-binding protein
MKRRAFLAGAGAGVGAAAAAVVPAPLAAAETPKAGSPKAPAIVQRPEIKWRCASSYPKSLDTIYGAAELIGRRVAEATDGRFQIRIFAAGELVPGLAVLDAVQNGTVECGHTASYYYVGKDPTFALDCAIPFGLTSRQQNAWLYEGGGLSLLRAFFARYNVVNVPAGNTGAQMGGWFRKEIASVGDLAGLKFRIGGFAGQVLQRLGVVPQQIAGGDIYPALEKGTIDAAEWVGPYDDEKLGFYKVAPYYYYPGFWEAGPTLSLLVGKPHWDGLPPAYRAALEAACAEANLIMQARYDAQNPAALRRLVAGGALLRPFPKPVMAAAWDAAQASYDELVATNPNWKTIYESWKQFRDEEFIWFRIAENRLENFMYAQTARKKG